MLLISSLLPAGVTTAYRKAICGSGRMAANRHWKYHSGPSFRMPISFWLIPLTLENWICPCNLHASLPYSGICNLNANEMHSINLYSENIALLIKRTFSKRLRTLGYIPEGMSLNVRVLFKGQGSEVLLP